MPVNQIVIDTSQWTNEMTEHWRFGFKQWTRPGINGLKHPYDSVLDDYIPPSFAEMIKIARNEGEMPVYGIRPKLTPQLLELLD